MKKILKYILLSFVIFGSIWTVSTNIALAADPVETEVTVTEKIPGMDCGNVIWNDTPWERKYKCKVKWDFSAVMWFIAWFVKYVTLIWILVWVLMLVVSWINLSISWDKKKAKDKLKQVILSLLVILFMWFILNSIAPWIYK